MTMTNPPSALLLARSHIAMIAGLIGGLALILWLEGIDLTPAPADPMAPFADVQPLPLAAPKEPTQPEMEAAALAWRYFQNNISAETGLVASVDGYPSTTMWETGALIDAVVAAERLGLLPAAEAEAILARTISSLTRLPLGAEGLPNKAYDTRSLAMVNYRNEPTETGIGWSALDIGRLLAALEVAERAHPALAGPIQNLLTGWNMAQVLMKGELNGGNIKDGVLTQHQEGRVGYEQYAAKAMMLHALDATAAMDVSGQLAPRLIGPLPVPGDNRLNRNNVPAMITSEPYLLDGLEFGFDARSHVFATQIYRAQEQRFADTGILTAVSEGHINVAPYFAYATVWGGGDEWAVLTLDGTRLDSKRVISTKAAFGWDALFDTPYTDQLVIAVSSFRKPGRGWMEGMYEVDGQPNTSVTANTNAMILAAIAFRKTGPLLQAPK